jgi:hypothetical protein
MATTTNYGWTTPDDTALVKDGAAAIRTLGSSVDTTTKALNPSTTLGDIEYRSSTANTNTRLGIGTTGQVLTVAGGVPTWATSDDANAIQNALLTTTGDTIYASGASTPARLGIGSTGNVLTVAGGVPTWAAPAAGGMTVLASGSLSSTTLTLNTISASYKNLQLYVSCSALSAGSVLTMTINNITSQSYHNLALNASDNTASTVAEKTYAAVLHTGTLQTNPSFVLTADFYQYATSDRKLIRFASHGRTSAPNELRTNGLLMFSNGTAISRIDILSDNGNMTGTYVLYGMS